MQFSLQHVSRRDKFFAIFLFRAALHEVELGSTFRNALQQLATSDCTVNHPFSNFPRNLAKTTVC